MEEKKWVFDEIVHNETDVVGLISYSLYKNKKRALATSLRQKGASEEVIQSEVKTFHDQALMSNSLDDYRKAAEKFIYKLIEENSAHLVSCYEDEILKQEKRHEKEVKRLNSQHTKTLDAQSKSLTRKLYKKIQSYPIEKKPLFYRFMFWTFSGVPSALASLFLMAILWGAMTMSVSEETKQAIFVEAMEQLMDIRSQKSNVSAN